MIVRDIISEAKEVLGKCDEQAVFRRITDAVRLANNQGKLDVNIGYMDLYVCDGCVTLPPDVGTVLAVNNSGFPTLIRDQWFQYHANGSGTSCFTPWGYTDELGAVVTYKDPKGPVKIVAVVENTYDNNAEIRVFGYDENGKRIYTTGPGGVLQDGFLIPARIDYALPNPEAPNVARIERIQKPVTNGFIKLLAVDPTTLSGETQIGYYQPWETNPVYRRIKVPDRTWFRIKYKKKDLEVRSSEDWINIDNREIS